MQFDYGDNPNASFDDLQLLGGAELRPRAVSGEIELINFDISRSVVTDEAEYEIKVRALLRSASGYVTSPSAPIELRRPGCAFGQTRQR
jgi:hypothetical protein